METLTTHVSLLPGSTFWKQGVETLDVLAFSGDDGNGYDVLCRRTVRHEKRNWYFGWDLLEKIETPYYGCRAGAYEDNYYMSVREDGTCISRAESGSTFMHAISQLRDQQLQEKRLVRQTKKAIEAKNNLLFNHKDCL